MRNLREFTRCSLLAGAAIGVFGSTALGQTAAPAVKEAEAESDTIIVTGTRIKRAGYDTLEPATVVSAAYLEARGITNVADALNEIPGFGIGVTPEGGQSSFGVGQNFVNRFGLGTARTLTLVNGRRYVSSNAPTIFGPAAPGSQVDLNVIPSIMVERTENISIGGAPTYGSDAIAGTVNVILKKNFDGIEVRGLTGITSRGDGFRYNLSGLVGRNFMEGKGNITVALSYDAVDGVLQSASERFRQAYRFDPNPLASAIATSQPTRTPLNDGRVNTSIPFNTSSTDGIPNAVLSRNGRFQTFTAGGLLFPSTGGFNLADGRIRGFGTAQTNYLQFAPDGSIIPFNPGTNFGNNNASGGDGFDLVQTAPLTADLKRFTANMSARYELFEGVTAFFEGTYYKAKALELIDQSIYNANLFGGLSAPITVQAAYPLLSASARTTLTANSITAFRVSRASRDLVNNNARAENTIWRGVGGLEGDLNLFGKQWNWEASANFGSSKGFFEQTVLNQQRFVNAVNVTTNAQNQIVCAGANVPTITVPTAIDPDTLPAARRADKVNGPRFNAAFPTGQNYAAQPDPACVPLSIFGEGAPSQAARDYVTGNVFTESVLKQRVFNFNFGGDLFSVFADPIAINVGYEHRAEEGGFTPNEFQQIGRGRAVAILPNNGKYNTDEVFGEAIVPILNDENGIPFVHVLEAVGKIRYVDNTVNGGFTSYTYGGRFQPIPDIEIRGNFTRSFRAPAITELFTTVSDIFSTVPDPCDSRNVNGGTKPAIRAANCAAFYSAFGIANPASFQSNAVGATVRGTTSGDASLKNEQADAWTIGAVLRPRFVPGLRVAVDYYSVRIDGVIANLNATALSTGCFDNINFNTSDVQNANQFCSRLRRLPNGQIDPDGGVRTGFVNGDYLAFKGWSAEANYKVDLDDVGLTNAGALDLQGSIFWTKRLDTSTNGVAVDFIDQEIGTPEWAGQFNIGYTKSNFGFDFQGNFQSSVLFDRDFTVESRDILVLDRYWSFNSSVSYKFKENSLVRFSVTNLFDVDPPFPLAGAALGVYDTLGRRYSVSMQLRF